MSLTRSVSVVGVVSTDEVVSTELDSESEALSDATTEAEEAFPEEEDSLLAGNSTHFSAYILRGPQGPISEASDRKCCHST